jgi:hypothetical protein
MLAASFQHQGEDHKYRQNKHFTPPVVSHLGVSHERSETSAALSSSTDQGPVLLASVASA